MHSCTASLWEMALEWEMGQTSKVPSLPAFPNSVTYLVILAERLECARPSRHDGEVHKHNLVCM